MLVLFQQLDFEASVKRSDAQIESKCLDAFFFRVFDFLRPLAVLLIPYANAATAKQIIISFHGRFPGSSLDSSKERPTDIFG